MNENDKQGAPFDFTKSMGQTLEQFEHLPEGSKADYQRAKQALAHVKETPKNEHDSGDVLNKSGNVDMMREALRSALAAMRLHCAMYPQMDKGFMVDAREQVLQALAAEPVPLVRLTEEDIDAAFSEADKNCMNDRRFAVHFANAIMDAMQEKNK